MVFKLYLAKSWSSTINHQGFREPFSNYLLYLRSNTITIFMNLPFLALYNICKYYLYSFLKGFIEIFKTVKEFGNSEKFEKH